MNSLSVRSALSALMVLGNLACSEGEPLLGNETGNHDAYVDVRDLSAIDGSLQDASDASISDSHLEAATDVGLPPSPTEECVPDADANGPLFMVRLAATGLDERPDAAWIRYDDRLFSRNYDRYVDLLPVLQAQSLGLNDTSAQASVHTYFFLTEASTLRFSARAMREAQSLINGQPWPAPNTPQTTHLEIQYSVDGGPFSSTEDSRALSAGLHRVLIRVARTGDGPFGFVFDTRLESGVDPVWSRMPISNSSGLLTLPALDTLGAANSLPIAYREWPYGKTDAQHSLNRYPFSHLRRDSDLAKADAFAFQAEGGAFPYRYRLVSGSVPEGMHFCSDGRLIGHPSINAALGNHALRVEVTDSTGEQAFLETELRLEDRPNRVFEDKRLLGLIHNPASFRAGNFEPFAQLMKRQGYGYGIPISFGNGDCGLTGRHFPSSVDGALPDRIEPIRAALRSEGVGFGMYFGNFVCDGQDSLWATYVRVREATLRYQPEVYWFDWAAFNQETDALFSMIRVLNPHAIILINGAPTMSNGDFDAVDFEGWGGWAGGATPFTAWPILLPEWHKQVSVDSWRPFAESGWGPTAGLHPSWTAMLQVQLSLIAQGFVANIDHSMSYVVPTPDDVFDTGEQMEAHRAMADWVSPASGPSLVNTFTNVRPLFYDAGNFGYVLASTDERTLYAHAIAGIAETMGRTGFVPTDRFSVRLPPLLEANAIRRVRHANSARDLPFEVIGNELSIDTRGVPSDSIDTIFEIQYEDTLRYASFAQAAPHLAYRKPVRLLDAQGINVVPASATAYGMLAVDGLPISFAVGANSWAWTLEVDLESVQSLREIRIVFSTTHFPTRYRVLWSTDGTQFQSLGERTGDNSGQPHLWSLLNVEARYVRVQAITPDGPDQVGQQMGVAEIEVR